MSNFAVRVRAHNVKALKLFDWNKGPLSEARSVALCNITDARVSVFFCNYGEPITNPNTPRWWRFPGIISNRTIDRLAIARLDAEAMYDPGLIS